MHWSVELNSPNNLKRQGWTRGALKAGDKVTVRLNPLRDGQPGGLFLDVTHAMRQSARFRPSQERRPRSMFPASERMEAMMKKTILILAARALIAAPR